MNLRSILFACLAANGAQGTPQTVKIACFGDSVTAGSRAEGQPWCKQLRKLLAEHKEVYVFDVTEFSECVPCSSGTCEVGECVPDARRRGLRFGMSTSGCCRGA